MAVYATWEYYSVDYGGNQIAEADFPRLSTRASEDIDAMTFGRAASEIDEDIIDLLARAACAIAEVEGWLEASGQAVAASERVGAYSVTYANPVSAEKQKLAAAKRYLANTELLYAGVDCAH